MGELPAPFSAVRDLLRHSDLEGMGSYGNNNFAVILPASLPYLGTNFNAVAAVITVIAMPFYVFKTST